MKTSFNGNYGLIYLTAKIYRRKENGKIKDLVLNLALDTGASATVISLKGLLTIGYDLKNIEDEAYITTGSGLITIPKIRIEKLSALGKEKTHFLINAHDLPPTASVDGVLGLDFLRENVLTIDFMKGELEMINPKQQLKEFQEKLEKRVLDLGQKLEIVKFFEECKREQEENADLIILNDFRHFFIPVWTALKSEILINLNSLFDESKNAKRSLIHFIKQVKANLKVLRENSSKEEIKLLEDEIEEQIKIISLKKTIFDSIKTLRDGFYAHHDPKYLDAPEQLLKDAPLPFDDVVELIEFCRSVLNWHQKNTILCATILWNEDSGRMHLENIFCFLRRYFKMCDEVKYKYGSSTLLKMWK